MATAAVVATLLCHPTPAPAAAPAPEAFVRVGTRPDADRPRTVTPTRATSYVVDRAALLRELSTGRVELPGPDGAAVAFEVQPTSVLAPEDQAVHPELRTWAGTAVDGPATVRIDATPAGVHASVRGDGPSWYVDPAYRDDDSLHLSYAGADLPAPEQGLVEPALPARAERRAGRTAAPSGAPDQPVRLRTYRLALLSGPDYAAYVRPGAASNAESDAAVLAAKVTLVNRLDQVYGDDLGIRFTLAAGTGGALNLWTAAEAEGANGPCGLSACFPPGMLAAGCRAPVLDRNRWVTGQLVGARNYDIGHLVLGTDGGLAYRGVAGTPTKAAGCTGLSAPSGDGYAVDYLAHELGHQLGADHTFEGAAGGCAGNRWRASAVEPGSGSTVMAYAGTCGADDLQTHSDPVFSTASRDAVEGFVTEPAFGAFEWQSVALRDFDGADSFALRFGSVQTAAFTRGSGYDATTIKNAIMAAVPGTAVQVRPFFDTGAFDGRGFALYFQQYAGTFFGAVPEPTVVPLAGSFSAEVNDVDAGSPATTTGGTVTTSANRSPVVVAPANRTIPVRTPFQLTGSATDRDGDALGYLWEQTDVTLGTDGTGLTTEPKTSGPLFRVFGTASSTFGNGPGPDGRTRSFPDLAQVVAGRTNADTGGCASGPGRLDCLSEWLPTSAYTGSLHFRLTARDGSPLGGGTASDDVVLTLDRSTGPFRVTSQAAAATVSGGSVQDVTWTTGTAALAANVRITLSTDGGATFPTVLVASTPNDGSAEVRLPDLSAGAARLRVEAVDNYFYDVNDAAFTIRSTGGPPPLLVDSSAVPAVWATQFSDPAAVSFSASGGTSAPTAVSTPLPAGLALTGTGPWTIGGTPTAAPGSYPVTVTVSAGAESVPFAVTVMVAPEDATVAYTGPTAASGPVVLTAQVAQAPDGSPGSLAAATVRFAVDGTVACAAAAVSAAGVASCPVEPAVGSHTVSLAVGGAYRGTGAGSLAVSAPPQPPPPAAPDTSIVSGPSGWLLATSATFGFAASAPVSAYTCRLDGAKVPCSGTSVSVSGLTQRTHRLSVAADGDPTPATRDFAVPLDDAALTASGRWKRKQAGSAYLGTLSETTRRGAALSAKVSGARELAVLVRGGTVKVYLNGTLLRTVRGTGRPVRIPLATPGSGTVRLVAASGKKVRIDGLGVSTVAF